MDENIVIDSSSEDDSGRSENNKESNFGSDIEEDVLDSDGVEGKGVEFSKSILAITTNNASNNITFIEEALQQKLLESPEAHIRCFAHILNLSAKSALEVMQESLMSIHSLISHLRNSSHEKRLFKKKCKDNNIPYTTPKLNNETRWNSTYEMLAWAIKYKLALSDVLYENNKTKRWKNAPVISSDDWDHLHSICDFLKPFKRATTEIQAEEYPTIGLVIPWYNTLHDHCYETMENNSNDSTEYDAANEALSKLKKYYDISSKHLIIGVMLDPHYKLDFFERNHPSRTLEEMGATRQHALGVFKKMYNDYAEEFNQEHQQRGSSVCHQHNKDSDDDTIHPMKRIRRIQESGKLDPADEQVTYLKHFAHCQWEKSAYEWWAENHQAFPVISKMARDFLGIPASSASSERAFSSSGNLISDKRTSLSDESIEANMCLKNWMVSGILEKAKSGSKLKTKST